MDMPTPLQIAEAWHGVTGVWFTRRNKAHDDRQWEVVHDDGADMHIMGRYGSQEYAAARAKRLDDIARGAAVRRLIETMTV